jgi:hypothetical protein
MSEHYHLSNVMSESRREELCDWVRANGLDPGRIPADSTVRIEDGQLTVDEVVYGAEGRPKPSFSNPNSVQRTTRTVPLLVPWPVGVSA